MDPLTSTVLPSTDLFLSHSSRDKKIVEQLAEGLLEEEGLHCWIDIWAIPAAADWEAEILKALEGCRGCLVFLGESGWGPYHLREAELALERHRKDETFVVIPVLLPGAKAEDMDALGGLFEIVHRVEYRVEEERESLRRIASALGAESPFPLGRPRMSAYTVRRDGRRWQASGKSGERDGSILYRGKELATALAIEEKFPGQLDVETVRFLRAAERAKTSRLQRLVGIAAVLVAVFASLFIFTLVLRKQVEARSQEAQANNLGNLAKVLREEDPTRALRVAELAYDLDASSAAARQAMLGLFYDELQYSSFDEGASVRAMEVSSDGCCVLLGGYGDRVHFKTLDGETRSVFEGEYRHVTDVALSPDGSQALVGSYHQGAHIYDLQGRLLRQIGPENATVFGVAYAADGQSVLTAELSGRVSRWALDGTALTHYPSSGRNAQVVTVSDDGQYVAAGFNKVFVWQLDGALLRQLEPPRNARTYDRRGTVRGLSFVGPWIVAAYNDGSVLIWGANDQPLVDLQAHEETVWDLAVSPDGGAFVTAGYDRTAKVWRIPRYEGRLRELQRGPAQVLRGHSHWVTAVAWAPDGQAILTGSMDGSVRRFTWAEIEPQPLTGPRSYQMFVDFSPDGRLLSNGEPGAEVLGLEGESEVAFEHEARVEAGVFSPDGQRVLTAENEGPVRLWSRSGESIRSYALGETARALCFRNISPEIIAGGEGGRLVAWDLSSSEIVFEDREAAEINGMACSADGTRIATAGGPYFQTGTDEQQTLVLRRGDGTVIQRWTASTEQVAGVAFAPESDLLILGGNRLELSDTESPESRRALTAGYVAYMFDREGRLVRRLGGHDQRVNSVAFSSTSRDVLTGFGIANTEGGDGFKIWDRRGNLLYERATADPVKGVAFAPDGRHFATIEDHALRLWLTPEGIRERLRKASIDTLSEAEKQALVETGAFPQ